MSVAFGPIVGVLLALVCRTWMTAQEAVGFYGLVAFAPLFVSLILSSKRFGESDAIVFGMFMLSGFILGMGVS